MRKFITFSIFILISAFSLYSQPCIEIWNKPSPTGEHLINVYVSENGNYFAGGTSGLILSKLPQGHTQTHFFDADIFKSINFINESVGYAVSNSGHLAKTIDGGNNWNLMQFPYSDMLSKVLSSSKYPIIILGYETIYLSQDEVNWEVIDLEWIWLADMAVINDDFLAVGTFEGELMIVEIETGEYETKLETLGQIWVDFADENIGYALSFNWQGMDYSFEIYNTQDGGANWEKMPDLPLDYYASNLYVVNSETILLLDSWYQQIYLSRDGGNTWSKIKEPTEEDEFYFYDLGYNSKGKLVVVGASGFLLVSDNWGEDWNLISEYLTQEELNSVSFVDPLRGWIAGDDYIYRTVDGGVSWETLFPPNEGFFWNDFIHFRDESNGFLSSSDFIYKTKDAGNSWEMVELDVNIITEVIGMKFFDNNYGFLYGNAIYKTNDAGDSWELVYFNDEYDLAIPSVSFYDNLNGFAFGLLTDFDFEMETTFFTPLLLKTNDAGLSWQEVENLPLIDVLVAGYFDGPTSGILVGAETELDPETGEVINFNTLVYRTDDLVNWELLQIIENNVCAIGEFINRDESVFLCYDLMQDGLYINSITDNGEGLAVGRIFYAFLNDFDLVSTNQGWVVGENGSLIELHCNFTSVEDNPVNQPIKIDFDISPNPASDYFTISSASMLNQEYKLNITDLLGNVVYTDILDMQSGKINKTINISHLSAGAYQVSIITGNTTAIKKIIITR